MAPIKGEDVSFSKKTNTDGRILVINGGDERPGPPTKPFRNEAGSYPHQDDETMFTAKLENRSQGTTENDRQELAASQARQQHTGEGGS